MTPCIGINAPEACKGCARSIRPSGRVPEWVDLHVSGCLPVPVCANRIEKPITTSVRGLSAKVCGQDASGVTERFGMGALLGVSVVLVAVVAFVAVAWPGAKA